MYNDPSGHCPQCILIGIPLAGFAVGFIGYQIENHTMWWSSKQAFEGSLDHGVQGAVAAMGMAVGIGEAELIAQEAGPVIDYVKSEVDNLGKINVPAGAGGDPENFSSNLQEEIEQSGEVVKNSYLRPKYRTGVRGQVWDNAKDSDGIVRDPITGASMNEDEPWDMGHKPGYEFVKHQISASERGISRGEFIDEHNDITHYRPELPSSNRNHKGEAGPDVNLWP